MKPLNLLWLALTALLGVYALDGYTVPTGSPGFQRGNSTQAVQFDSHSLFVDGKQIFRRRVSSLEVACPTVKESVQC